MSLEWFHKKKEFIDLAQTYVDGKHNFIVSLFIRPSRNVDDSLPYVSLLDYIVDKFNFDVNCVALDRGYYYKKKF
ncbi:hypothetical protein [Gemella sp. zg-1178]|uniref:hypothetical protein n=1 Tax=Gemella sp. zg-1178 TaxID=2840372 RepID=UPI001C055287|nr:hypothetical protein [Gemella sp. zg-1178]MBU0278870.1 hypothetical protein [Gemella sp. zg-1178]